MKIKSYFFGIALGLVLTSCSWLTTDVDIDKKTYFFEIIDSTQTDQSKKVIDGVYAQLQNEEFVLSLEDNDWQGIVSYNDEVDLSNLSEYYPEIHTFRRLKADSDVNSYDGKIELVYKISKLDSIPNFDIKRYFRGADNKMWKPYANPGNFRFNAAYYRQNDQPELIKRTIVGLTFK